MRQFLDALAERHQLDPLQPETWYKIKMPDVVKSGVCTNNYTKLLM